MRKVAALAVLMAGSLAALAEDRPAAEIPRITDPPAPDPNAGALTADWVKQFKLGAFLNSAVSQNAPESRDPSLAGGHESTSYQLSFDGKLDWISGKQRVEQTLAMKYGRVRQDHEDWEENTDQIDYDGAYKYLFKQPHYWYGAWGGDTVFTGPDPYNEPFNPLLAKVSAGYGQMYENFQQLSNKFDARVGVRAQQRFGARLAGIEDDVEIGPEFVARYERQQTEALNYFAQYEAFSEFEDMGHISNLVTAGLDLLLAPYMTLRLAFRGYYEAEPEDAPDGSPGYDEFSYRQETLLGLTFVY